MKKSISEFRGIKKIRYKVNDGSMFGMSVLEEYKDNVFLGITVNGNYIEKDVLGKFGFQPEFTEQLIIEINKKFK